MAADAMSNENPLLTISTDSSNEFLVYIFNWRNDVWMNIDKVFVSIENSRQIWHNKTYPTYYFYVWTFPVIERQCEDTLGQHFNLSHKVSYKLRISSSHLNESAFECSLAEAAKDSDTVAWIILGVLLGLVGLCGLIPLALCIWERLKSQYQLPNIYISSFSIRNVQTRRGNSTQTPANHRQISPRIEPSAPTRMSRPLPPTWRVEFRPQNEVTSIQGQQDEARHGRGQIRLQRDLPHRYYSSTVMYKYVKYTQENCSICICELAENDLVRSVSHHIAVRFDSIHSFVGSF